MLIHKKKDQVLLLYFHNNSNLLITSLLKLEYKYKLFSLYLLIYMKNITLLYKI